MVVANHCAATKYCRCDDARIAALKYSSALLQRGAFRCSSFHQVCPSSSLSSILSPATNSTVNLDHRQSLIEQNHVCMQAASRHHYKHAINFVLHQAHQKKLVQCQSSSAAVEGLLDSQSPKRRCTCNSSPLRNFMRLRSARPQCCLPRHVKWG